MHWEDPVYQGKVKAKGLTKTSPLKESPISLQIYTQSKKKSLPVANDLPRSLTYWQTICRIKQILESIIINKVETKTKRENTNKRSIVGHLQKI